MKINQLNLNELLSRLSCKNSYYLFQSLLNQKQNILKKMKLTLIKFVWLIEQLKKFLNSTKIQLKELNNYQLQIAQHLCNGFSTLNALPLQNVYRYPTGIKEFDNILKQGISSNLITELIGLPNFGKSNFCQNLIEFIVINKIPSKILYIDSGNQFNYERIIKKLNLNHPQIQFLLMQIKHITAKCPLELQLALFSFEEYQKNQHQKENYLIIIDSFSKIMYPFSIPEYCHNLLNMQKKFRQLNSKNIGILLVNSQKQTTYNSEHIKSILITPWTIGSAHKTINISKSQQYNNQFEFNFTISEQTSSFYSEFAQTE